MKYNRFFWALGFACALILIPQSFSRAATFPMAGIDVLVKSIANSRVIVTTTGSDGGFSVTVPPENGLFYNVFVSDENSAPIKMPAKNNVVSGKIVIITDGTTTKDPVPPTPPAPTKKTAKKTKK